AAIIFDALSFLASAFLLGGMERDEPVEASTDQDPTLISDLKIGLGASLFHPLVGPEFLVEANSAIWNGFFLALYTIYSLDTLGLSAGTLGLVISAGGIGALFGAVLAGRMSSRMGLGPAMIACLAGTRLAAFFIPLAQGPLWFAVGCLLVHQLLGDALVMSYYVLA